MKNGDYAPNRFQAQADAVNLICGAKTQMSVQDGAKDSLNQSEMAKLLEDQPFISSVLSSLPGVDPNDPSAKELLASMQNPS